jgi:hypothetical protein
MVAALTMYADAVVLARLGEVVLRCVLGLLLLLLLGVLVINIAISGCGHGYGFGNFVVVGVGWNVVECGVMECLKSVVGLQDGFVSLTVFLSNGGSRWQ